MKKHAIALSLFCFVSLIGCSPAEETVSPTDTDSSVESTETSPEEASQPGVEATPAVEVSAYSRDELLSANGGGCGMSLLAAGTEAQANSFLFFNGVEENAALMKLNGELSQLTQTAASGEEFYGQQTSQSFETADGAIAVDVDVTLGELGEIESVTIPEGTLTVTSGEQSEEIAVVGDAGC